MPHRSRAERDLQRSRAAASATRTAGSALDAALAQIAAAFDEAAAINDFKLRLERWLRLGPQYPAVRARFRARAAALPDCTLDAAIATVERWWCEEKKAFTIASALGYGNRLSLETLRECRLLLWLMRFKGMASPAQSLRLCAKTGSRSRRSDLSPALPPGYAVHAIAWASLPTARPS